jgi:hypothetical protein
MNENDFLKGAGKFEISIGSDLLVSQLSTPRLIHAPLQDNTNVNGECLGEMSSCIYCGATTSLTKEHIIPYGLNGRWTLKKASCLRCAAITSKFEQNILREILLSPRVKLNLRTRDRKNRPSELPMTITKDGKKETIKVRPQNHFTLLMMPEFNLPTYLDDRPYEKGIDLVGMVAAQIGGPTIDNFRKQYDKISIPVKFTPVDFARLIAKIAYGYTVAKLGMDLIKDVYVIPAILGISDDIGRWVGCSLEWKLPPQNDDLHCVEYSVLNDEIYVRVRLFAHFDTPEYFVVVGHV